MTACLRSNHGDDDTGADPPFVSIVLVDATVETKDLLEELAQ